MIIFWLTKNLTMYIYDDVRWVANSLRHILASSYYGWGQRDIFFQFFCTQKTQKNSKYQPTKVTCWHKIRTFRIMSGKCPKVEILELQNSSFWRPRIALFRTLSDMVRSSEIAKICKNLEIPQNPEKVQIWALLGCLKGILRVQPESQFWALFSGFGRFGQMSGKCRKCSQKLSGRSEKSAKKIAKFSVPRPPKFRKSAPISCDVDDRGWRHRAFRGPKKNALFWHFLGVKGNFFPARP